MGNDSKKSFIFYASWKEVLSEYPSEVRLEVYDAVIEYAISGTLTELKPLAKMAFSFIRKDIDANNERYDEMVSKRREAGKKGMQSRWSKADNKCYDVITNITNITDNDNKDKDDNKDDNNLDTYTQKDELPEASVVKKKEDKIDYKSIVERFNSKLSPPLPKVQTISDARKKAMKARVNEHGEDAIDIVFDKVFESKFLRGETESGWKCHFDWIFNPRNFVKILEGNYANNRANYSEKQRANDYAMQKLVESRTNREQGLVIEVENPF